MTQNKTKKLFSLDALKSLIPVPEAATRISISKEEIQHNLYYEYFPESVKKKKSNPLGKKDSRTLRRRNKFHPTRDYYYWPPGLSNRKSKAIKWETMKRNNALKRIEQATRRALKRKEAKEIED